MPKVNYRTKDGWSGYQPQKEKETCEKCGARLWITPGATLYCNAVHDDIPTQTSI